MVVVDPSQQIHSIALAVQFSYHGIPTIPMMHESTIIMMTEARIAGERLQTALVAGVAQYVSTYNTPQQQQTKNVEGAAAAPPPPPPQNNVSILGSSSQGSLARLRHVALDQEAGCAAVGDTMVVRIQGPHLSFHDDLERQRFLERLIHDTNQILRNDTPPHLGPGGTVQVEACKLLSLQYGKLLHCEQMCTQRVYHYLLPLRWLPDGKDLEQWWIETSIPEDDQGNTNKSSVRPPSEALKRMKQYLRSAEAERLDRNDFVGNDNNGNADEEEDNVGPEEEIRRAVGRFGSLGEKKRVPWHNFADPNLQGSASPNTKPVWRVLDRARFQLLMSRELSQQGGGGGGQGEEEEKKQEVVAVLEFRGDDFLPQQIRRIVGTTLAMTHGWLPKDTLDVATRSNCLVETVLAPAGRLYLVENRFHWDEMRTGGKSIFESDVDGVAVQRHVGAYNDSAMTSIPNHILDVCDNDATRSQEIEWLAQLEHIICPRIKQCLEEWNHPPESSEGTPTGTELNDLEPAPREYTQTLDLLRKIVATDQWPETSVARSSVISNVKRDPDSVVHKKGSFTVINPRFNNGMYKNGIGNDPLPLGNELFPELAEAVFDLEEAIILNSAAIQQAAESNEASLPEASNRVSSSHCAINCNAQFTPHVDSGRGAGQSLSMIVGLGDYLGGALGVEGVGYDIRYRPLEFDGWRLRHWTKPFQGERFSLVWFTPELKGDEKVTEQSAEPISTSSY